MKKLCLFLVCFIPFLSLKGQDTYSIINELRNTFKNYQIKTPTGPITNGHTSNKDEVSINYSEPIITIQFIRSYYLNAFRYVDEVKNSFDVLKSRFYDSSFYSSSSGIFKINCPSGIDVYEREQCIPTFGVTKPTEKSTRNLLVLFYFKYLHKPIKKKCQRRIK